jgi:hypothetical protein
MEFDDHLVQFPQTAVYVRYVTDLATPERAEIQRWHNQMRLAGHPENGNWY